MKKAQKLIIIDGYTSEEERNMIAGFAAVQVVNMVDEALLSTIFYHNKNAVFFSGPRMELRYEKLNPFHIHISRTASTSLDDAVLSKKSLVKDFAKMLDFYDIDAGDHSSEDSTNLDEYDETNCLFCKIRDRRNEKPEHILFETDHFYVVPGAGAIVDGYILLLPKQHILSFAALPEEQRDEFISVLYTIKSIISAIYGKPVIAFENGTGSCGGGKHETSILHAHFHFMPIEGIDILKAVQNVGVHPTYVDESDLFKYGTYPYRLIIDQHNNWFIASDADDYYPRQLVRQVVADSIGLEEGAYNWRTHPEREKMDKIAETFRSYCEEHFSTLPKWVKKSLVLHD